MGDEQIMMSVDKPEALVAAEIHAMRQVADAIALQGKQVSAHMEANTRAMERLGERVEGMNSRLIRLEEQKHGREIERLVGWIEKIDSRIDKMQSLHDQQKGAKALVDWLRQTAPWIFAVGAAAIAAAGWKPGS